jgi:hypothetical protein
MKSMMILIWLSYSGNIVGDPIVKFDTERKCNTELDEKITQSRMEVNNNKMLLLAVCMREGTVIRFSK